MSRKTKSLVFSGALILAVSGVIVKVLGMLYKIPLTNIMQDEGMGYFNSAYTIYTVFYMLSTAGLPVAVSLLVSEACAKKNRNMANRILKITTVLFMTIGIIGSSLMFFGADEFSKAIGNSSARACILAISPTLLFACVISSLRGYFQGHQYMVPTAVSQIIEAFGKFTLGILLARIAISKSYDISVVAAYAIYGLVLSSAAAMIYLMIAKKCFREEYFYDCQLECNDVEKTSATVKRIAKIAIPVTISSSAMSLAGLLDLTIVMRRLQAVGYTEAVANSLYGNYSSLAVPLFNMPTVLILPIAYSVVPYLRAAMVSGEKMRAKDEIIRTIRITALIAMPASLGMSVLAKPILSLIYTNPASVEAAAPLLEILSVSVFFVSLLAITNAVLQACGNVVFPIVSMGIGVAVKIISCYYAVGKIGISGTPLSTVLCYAVICAVNLAYIAAKMKLKLNFVGMFGKIFVSSALCSVSGLLFYKIMSDRIGVKLACVAAVAVAVIVYVSFILILGYIEADDIKKLPKGEVIYRFMAKKHLIKEKEN